MFPGASVLLLFTNIRILLRVSGFPRILRFAENDTGTPHCRSEAPERSEGGEESLVVKVQPATDHEEPSEQQGMQLIPAA